MAADDITNAELARRLDAMRSEFRDDFSDMRQQLGQFVLREVHAAQLAALTTRVEAAERQTGQLEERQQTSRRWVISAVLIPIAVTIFTVYFSLRGSA